MQIGDVLLGSVLRENQASGYFVLTAEPLPSYDFSLTFSPMLTNFTMGEDVVIIFACEGCCIVIFCSIELYLFI